MNPLGSFLEHFPGRLRLIPVGSSGERRLGILTVLPFFPTAVFPGSIEIDVWLQHPTERFITDPVFESLRRWVKLPAGGLPIEATIAVLDSGGIEKALISSWHGPAGELISNWEVYEWTQRFPERLYGLASVDLASPMKAIATLNAAVNP
jgi:hypothetical protein